MRRVTFSPARNLSLKDWMVRSNRSMRPFVRMVATITARRPGQRRWRGRVDIRLERRQMTGAHRDRNLSELLVGVFDCPFVAEEGVGAGRHLGVDVTDDRVGTSEVVVVVDF